MFLGANFDPTQVQTRRALLVLDFQNDFISKEGKLQVDGAERLASRVVPLASEFRETGDVVWVTTEFEGPRETISSDTGSYIVVLPRFLAQDEAESPEAPPVAVPSVSGSTTNEDVAPRESDKEAFLGDFGQDCDNRCCLPGSTGAAMPEQILAAIDRTRDMIFTKSDYSAFAAGSLLMTLRTKLVTELFLCGSLSHISVYATAVDAIRHGFAVTLVEDCLGHGDGQCHEEAIRQMKEFMGADSIPSGELAALLRGDGESSSELVTGRQTQVHTLSAKASSDSLTIRPKVEDWVNSLPEIRHTRPKTHTQEVGETTSLEGPSMLTTPIKLAKTRSADDAEPRPEKSKKNPPRKRSTGDIDDDEATSEFRASIANTRPVSKASSVDEGTRVQARPVRRRRTVKDEAGKKSSTTESRRRLPGSTQAGPSLERGSSSNSITNSRADQRNASAATGVIPALQGTQQDQSSGTVGEGDSYLVRNVLPDSMLDNVFDRLKSEVQWQKMYHRSGEVPRLVSVQGIIAEDDSIPIYRHPADESPPLLPYSRTVSLIARVVEKMLRHPVNHVLIQLYRDGQDNISEHSDKTLDIVRESNIVNLSIGAQRTMILRTKKAYYDVPGRQKPQIEIDSDDDSEHPAPRKTQRIALPHNSLFVLGQATNTSWLHSIRADKRRSAEKALEELAYGGQRISLTFRQVGTYISPQTGLIWGQGATSKVPGSARKIVDNDPEQVERMIKAFGEENHQAKSFDWEKTYGKGFDVINFTTPDHEKSRSSNPPPMEETIVPPSRTPGNDS